MRSLFLFLGVFATSLQAADAVFYKKLWTDMTEMFRTNPPAALEKINELISNNPTNPVYYYLRGGVRHGFNQPYLAIQDYTRGIDLDAPGEEIYQRRATEWLRLGYLEKALADLDTIADRWPTQAFKLWDRGVVCYELGDYEKAARQLVKYGEAYEHDVENAVWILMCQAKVENLKRARQGMIPTSGDQRVPMSQIYALFKGTGTVQQVLDAAANSGPRDPYDPNPPPAFYAQLYLGLYADLTGDRATALAELEAALEVPMTYNIMQEFARIHRDRLLRTYKTRFEPVPARLFLPRRGLGNFFLKLQHGGPGRVAFWGGGGTAAGGWPDLTMKWLRETYPAARLEQIAPPLDDTNSPYNAIRFERDVLSKKPDLVFVEIPADDAASETSMIWRNLESVLRQTWKVDESIDFCFVYSLAPGSEKELQGGRCPRAASAGEILAEYYDIPSINPALRVAEMAAQKKLVVRASSGTNDAGSPTPPGTIYFSKDGVHPSIEGSRLDAETICDSLKSRLVLRKPYHWLKYPFMADEGKP